MSETIPLEFEAIDHLTKSVASMQAALEALSKGHQQAEDAADEQAAAEESLRDKLAKLADVTSIAAHTNELATSAWERGLAVYEKLSGLVSDSLAAWDEQSKKSGKSASALGSVAEASAKLEKQKQRLYAQIGKVIEGSGVLQSALTITGAVLDEVRKLVKDNEDAAAAAGAGYGVEFAGGVKVAMEALKEAAPWIDATLTTARMLDDGLEILWETFKLLGNAVQLYFTLPLLAATEAVDALLSGIEQASAMAGVELPAAFKEARWAVQQINKDSKAFAGETLGAMIQNTDKMGGAVGEMVGHLGDLGKVESQIVKVAEAGERAADKAVSALGKVRGLGSRGRTDLVSPEDAAEEKRQAILLEYDRKILEAQRAKNDELAIQLTYDRALVEASQSLKDIKTATLRDATMALAITQAQAEREQSLKELAQQRRDERAEAHDIEMQARQEEQKWDELQDAKAKERGEAAMQRIKSRYEKEKEFADKINEYVSSAFDAPLSQFDELLGDQMERYSLALDKSNASIERRFELGLITEDQKARELEQNEQLAQQEEQRLARLSKLVNGMANVAKGTAQLTTSIRAYNAVGASAQQQQDALNAGLLAGVGILSGVTESFVEDKRKQAAIEALINAAAAAAAYATGNIPMGIGLTAAAAGYAAAAAFGGGGGGAASGSAGAGAGAASYQAPDLDRERGLTAEAIAEAIADKGSGGGVVINVDFGSSLIAAESPQAARIISDLVAPEIAQIVRRGR